MGLKPCPFCGGEATIKQWSSGKAKEMYTAAFKCGCNKCEIWFYGNTAFSLVEGVPTLSADGYKQAIEAWNRRCLDEQ